MDSLAHLSEDPEGLSKSERIERGNARAAALGIPPSEYGAWVWTLKPIDPEGFFILRVFQGGHIPPAPSSGVVRIRDKTLRRFAGCRLQFFGLIRGIAETVEAAPHDAPLQLLLPLIPHPQAERIVVDVWDARACPPSHSVYALMRWTAGSEQNWSVHGFSATTADKEWQAARHALKLLQQQRWNAGGGRHRMEISEPEKLELARKALKFRSDPRRPTWNETVDHLGMIQEEDYLDDPLANKKLYRTTVHRLQNSVKRLRATVNRLAHLHDEHSTGQLGEFK